MRNRLFTSESVSEGHPDKICDQVSDAVLDGMLALDPAARGGIETLCTKDYLLVAGEARAPSQFDSPAIEKIARSEEHTSELQSLMRISYAVFCLKKTT